MLKQKIKSLVAQNKLGHLNGFEIIHDQSAVKIIGGLVSCPNLSTCVTYTGDCPSLVTCGSFTDAS
jgi:hypothetical protein